MKRDLELLYEIGSLMKMPRGWQQHLGKDVSSVPEHSWRVAFIALIIARMEGYEDEASILKMALVHDIEETRTSDLSYIQKVYVTADEDRAAHDAFTGTSIEDYYQNWLKEYEARDTMAAKIVKDADNLDVDLELKEVEERGHKLPLKWRRFRKLVRDEKLYTRSAKLLWDEIQRSDPSSWHINANKWLKIPSAGK